MFLDVEGFISLQITGAKGINLVNMLSDLSAHISCFEKRKIFSVRKSLKISALRGTDNDIS